MSTNFEKLLVDTINLMVIEPSILFVGDDIDLADVNITDKPWSAIYTTQKNEKLIEFFKNDSRRVLEINEFKDIDELKFSRIDLPVVRLCGTSNFPIDAILQDQFQLAAIEKLPKLLSNYGHIFFTGRFSQDIVKNFCLKILEINRKQIVLMFGFSSERSENGYIQRIIDDEKAIPYESQINSMFIDIINEIESYNFNENKRETINSDVIFYMSGKPIAMGSNLDKEVLLNVRQFAQLLNVNDVERSNIFPPTETIQHFASFLQFSTTGFPQWYGYRENNCFHANRYFENELLERTKKILTYAATKERKGNPIMLRGQACCGKTNALSALAYRVFIEKRHPVLYIPESDINFYIDIEKDAYGNVMKKKTSSYEALEMLIRRIEEKSENPVPVLIVWDTACRNKRELQKASNLLFSLREDGRQVQIVCTGYSSLEDDEEINGHYSFIDVDIFLHNDEQCNEVKLIENLLIEKGGFQPADAKKYMDQYSAAENFFASLYMFREVHIDLKRRLRRENEGRIEDISEKIEEINKSTATERLKGVVAVQLLKYIDKFGWQISADSDEIEQEREVKSEERKKRLANIVCCIAFCTIYKEKLPVSIILRMLGDIDIPTTKVFDVIMNNSLLMHTVSPENDEPSVVVRSELEAQLILEEYKREKMDIVLQLIDYISPYNADELQLIKNIIRLIGPNNKNTKLSLWNQYNEEFDELLLKLSELRKKTLSEELILHEITLGREILKDNNRLNEVERKQRMADLIELANKAIEKHDSIKLDKFLSNVYVEWAQLCIRYSSLDPIYSKEVMFGDIERKLKLVINRYPKNGYAYSTYLWAGFRYAQSMEEADERKLELLEKLAAIRDVVEDELKDIDFDENILAEVDCLLDSSSVSEDRFLLSIEKGKAYGLYFKVRQIRGLGEDKLDYNSSIVDKKGYISRCRKIVKLLTDERYYRIAIQNPACLYALINTQWLLLTKEPIIPTNENVLVGLPEAKWRELYTLCKKYLDDVSNIRTARIVYLLALCAANLDDHRDECQDLFDEIRNAERFERRTLHIICDENKIPIKFCGRISGRYSIEKNRGFLYIDAVGISSPVFFRADKLGLRASQLRERMQLQDLCLATSFSGFQVCKV